MINEEKARSYCKDDISKIENYDKAIADKTETWVCHHRWEVTLEGEFAHSYEDLKRMGMYYKRPYFELIFLKDAEHRRLHVKGRSQEVKDKMAKSMRGKHHSDLSKNKMSKSMRGNTNTRNKPRTEFGRKYFAHYGYSCHENYEQYHKEKRYFYKHKKCTWE